MENKNIDVDSKQSLKDVCRRNQYAIDDRFVIRDGKIHKCAIICPGGGYGMVCSSIEGVPIARKLNELGISALIVYYRVRKKAHFPNPQDDLARAVREIHEKSGDYHLDMSDYSIWGSSAGGHLVGTFGTSTMGYKKYHLPKPGALILIYPVTSLEKEITHAGTRKYLIGKDASHEEELRRSVYTNVDKDFPPTFVWCGDADSTVPKVNTELMVQVLEKNNVEHESRIYPGVEHGVGPATGTAAEGWIDEAVRFWGE